MSSSTETKQSSPNLHFSQFLGAVELLASGQPARTWNIQQPKCVIGSEASCEVQISGFDIAPQHATILFSKRHALLRSASGVVKVNGRPVREWLFDQSVQFEIGTQQFIAYTVAGIQNPISVAPTSSNAEMGVPAGQLNGPALEKLVAAIFQPLKEALGELRDGIVRTENQQGSITTELQRESLERFETIKQAVLTTIENRFSAQDDRHEQQLSARLDSIQDLLSEYRNEITNVDKVAPQINSTEIVDQFDLRFAQFRESLGEFQANTLQAIESHHSEPIAMQVTAELPDDLREKIDAIADASANSRELIDEVYANRAAVESTQQSIAEVKSLLVEAQQAAEMLERSKQQSETAGLVEQIANNQLTQDQLQQELASKNDELAILNQRTTDLEGERDDAIARAAQLQETVEQVQSAQFVLEQQIATLSQPPAQSTEFDADAVAQQLADKDRELEEMRSAAEQNAAQWQAACEDLQHQRDHFERIVQQLQYDESVASAGAVATQDPAENAPQLADESANLALLTNQSPQNDNASDIESSAIENAIGESVASDSLASEEPANYDAESNDESYPRWQRDASLEVADEVDETTDEQLEALPQDGMSDEGSVGGEGFDSEQDRLLEKNHFTEQDSADQSDDTSANGQYGVVQPLAGASGLYGTGELVEKEIQPNSEQPFTHDDASESQISGLGESLIRSLEESEPDAEFQSPITSHDTSFLTDVADKESHEQYSNDLEASEPNGAVVDLNNGPNQEDATRDEEAYGALRNAFRAEDLQPEEKQLNSEAVQISVSAAEQRLDELMGVSNADHSKEPQNLSPDIEGFAGSEQINADDSYGASSETAARNEFDNAESNHDVDEGFSFDYSQFLDEQTQPSNAELAELENQNVQPEEAPQEFSNDSGSTYSEEALSQSNEFQVAPSYDQMAFDPPAEAVPTGDEPDLSSFGGVSYDGEDGESSSSQFETPHLAAAEPENAIPPEPENPEEDSVEAYMQRLLQRVQSGNTNSTTTTQQPSNSDTHSKEQPIVASPPPQPAPEPVVEEPGLLSADEFVPRTEAAERNTDMAAMRDLANSTARSAIETSIRKRNGVEVLFKSSVAVFGFLAAVALFFINGLSVNIALAGMVAGFIVACLWGYEAITQARTLLALEPPPEGDSAGDSDRLPSDDDMSNRNNQY